MAEGASLTVMGGPLAGTVLALDEAVDEILVGSDPDCRLSLDLPAVSPIHARVWRDLSGITVYDTRSARGVYVNDERVVDHAQLRDGDVLWLGPPGEPDSVMIQCRLPEESVLGAPVTGEPVSDEPGIEPDRIEPAILEPAISEPAFSEPEIDMPAPAMPSADERVPESLDDLVASEPDPLPFDPLPMDPSPEAPSGATVAFVFEDTPADPLTEEPPAREPVAGSPAFEPAIPERAAAQPAVPEPIAPAAAIPSVPQVAPPPPAPLEDFVMDPSWGESGLEEDGQTAAPPPLDLDTLLADDAAQVAIPPSEPEPAVAAAAPAPVVPVPAAPVMPVPAAPVVRQVGGSPPLVAAPQRAVIDDTRPRPATRPVPKRETQEGVMDWARGNEGRGESPAVPTARPASRPPRAPERSSRGPLLPIAGGILLLAALAGGYFAWSRSRVPRIDAVSPARATAGNVITLTGAHLGETAAEASASIGGRPARVVLAGGGRLQLEVPDLPAIPGRDSSVPIVVTTGGRESQPAAIALYQAPRLKTLAPEIGMPGDRIVLTGTSLGAGATVRFGDVAAEVVRAANGSLTVTVPAITVAAGTEVPVVASMGADPSNALEFLVGKAPLLTGVQPRSASPGDVVTIEGRGFGSPPSANVVKVDGVPALVISASPKELQFVVPRVTGGVGALTVTVPGSDSIGQEELAVTLLPDPAGFQFVAEPFADVAGHDHAAVSTGLGPAFILTSVPGKSAAERAYDAQKKLNEAAQVLRSTRTAEIRARYAPAAAIYLIPRDTVLMDVTAADAEGYNESWAPARAKGEAVTPGRLATWWEAVARDLVLLLLRGEKPTHAQALAPEGKVLAELHDAARRTVAVGVPMALVAGAKGPMRDALRGIALRVPASVTAPATTAEGHAVAAAAGLPPLKLDGSWRGHETENGVQKPITMTFSAGSGTLTYQRALSMSVPVLAVSAQKAAVRFEVRVGAGVRYYRGQWDGTRITGKLWSDPEGRIAVGTFELDPAR